MDNNHNHKRRRRRFVTSSAAAAADDIITNLSEDLINPILERLPIEDAVRTCVLSKKWRYRWTTMRTLEFLARFSDQFLEIGAYEHNGFIRVISHIMIHHHGPIFSFRLVIPKEIVIDSFQEVDHWMLILSRNSVNELYFANNLNTIYPVPSYVFSCLELRVLMLHNCIFKAPLKFQGFPNLKYLFLLSVDFGGNLGGSVINLPQLEYLVLHECDNVNNFNIKAERLQNLRVTDCPDANAVVLQLLHCEHLDSVYLCLSGEFRLDFYPCSFTVNGYFLKFLAAEKFPKWLPHAVKCTEKLEFISFSFGDLDQLQGALCMLRNSPNLKEFCVTDTQMGPEADLELTTNYLESPDCLYQTSLMLHYVELTSLEGSRPELLFVKLLLHCSPHLEKMIIRPAATLDAEKRLNIAKEVLMFPRASTKAKVAFLDPEP